MEALLVSVVDTTIAAQNMAAFAETQGLGISLHWRNPE